MAPFRCYHCNNTTFIAFDYLDNVLVLQCTNCKMVYGHQPVDLDVNCTYTLEEYNKENTHESES